MFDSAKVKETNRREAYNLQDLMIQQIAEIQLGDPRMAEYFSNIRERVESYGITDLITSYELFLKDCLPFGTASNKQLLRVYREVIQGNTIELYRWNSVLNGVDIRTGKVYGLLEQDGLIHT